MLWFVSSDVHSFYDEWQKALVDSGFDINNKDHGIIVCGDLMDRGNKPIECLKFVNNLHRQGRAILIKGNHEELLEDIFKRHYFERHDESNGTLKTCELISGVDVKGFGEEFERTSNDAIEGTRNNDELKYYLDNVVDYYEIDNYVFVHGWIPIEYKKSEDVWQPPKIVKARDWRRGDWSEARWLNGMDMWEKGVTVRGKTIICGHWHSSYGNYIFHSNGCESLEDALFSMTKEELRLYNDAYGITPEIQQLYSKYVDTTPFVDRGIIALDACSILSGRVNVFMFVENR